MSRRQYGTLQPVCSPGEPWGRLAGGGIAVASIDNSRCPSQKCLAKLCKRLALLFPQPGVFSGYTTVVSVIWQLSSALKGTFIKEIQYILLAPLHFLDQSAKGGMFPVSHFFSPPFFHISRCYWGSISTSLHMVKHVPESWHNVKKKKRHASKSIWDRKYCRASLTPTGLGHSLQITRVGSLVPRWWVGHAIRSTFACTEKH